MFRFTASIRILSRDRVYLQSYRRIILSSIIEPLIKFCVVRTFSPAGLIRSADNNRKLWFRVLPDETAEG